MRILVMATVAAAAMVTAAAAQPSGTTSGPAAGKQTTMGTGGQTTATPHMQDTLQNKGGTAVRNEQKGQAGGTLSSVQPGVQGAESGKPPAH